MSEVLHKKVSFALKMFGILLFANFVDDAIHSHSTIAISETIDTKKLLCYSWFAEKERIRTPFEGSNS